MTTAITVDAHAGWDVKVKTKAIDAEGKIKEEEFVQVVPANTKHTVYVHSHLIITEISEVRK